MKKIIGKYLFLLLLFSCNKSVEPVKVNSSKEIVVESVEPIKVYSWEEYEKAKSENPRRKLIVVDTICPYETKRAERDILKNRLAYYSRGYTEGVVDELNILTKKYGITAEYRTSSCIQAPEGFTEYCYENLMHKEIKKRYGVKWIDSLERIALKNYVIKHPNEPYNENGVDLRTKFLKNYHSSH